MFLQNWPRQGQNTKKSCSGAAKIENMQRIRAEIDAIDQDLLSLLVRRFELSAKIAEVKVQNGIDLKDNEREQEVLASVSRQLQNKLSAGSIQNVFQTLLNESLKHQELQLAKKSLPERELLLFPRVCIIGCGLIGGAFARLVSDCFPDTELFAVDLTANLCDLKSSGIFKDCSDNLSADFVKEANLIVIACPPRASLQVLEKLSANLGPGQLIIDFCSSKEAICMLAEQLDLKGAEFIGAHPFWGNEKSGFAHSAELELAKRTVCIVPGSRVSQLSVQRLRSFLESMNLETALISASDHDQTVSMSSHIIQLFASSLGSVIHNELLAKGKADRLGLSGAALAGLSRLMSSRPELWQEIVSLNKKELKNTAELLIKQLQLLLEDESEFEFQQSFARADAVRQHILKLKS